MNRRSGYVLLSLLLFFTVLSLSSSVAVLQQDTKLKRYSEEDLKINVDAFRRGLDLYRYKYSVTSPDSTKISNLDNILNTGTANDLAGLLAQESLIRARVATDSMNWKLVSNLVKNPSFENDQGADFGAVGTWRGNYTANDGVPDGWQLTADGAEQVIPLVETGTYIISFWARSNSATGEVRVRVWHDTVPCELSASETNWKRHYASFDLAAPKDVKLEIVQNSANSGDTVYIDGIMLEKWDPPADLPAGTAPSPSAWTKTINMVPGRSDVALQRDIFRDLMPEDTTSEDLSWWFNW